MVKVISTSSSAAAKAANPANGISKASLTIQKKHQDVATESKDVREILSTLHGMLPRCEGEDELEIMQEAIYYIQDLRDLLGDKQQLVKCSKPRINNLVPSAV